MQKRISYILCFVVAVFFIMGCNKDTFEPDVDRFISIAELRNMYKGTPVTISSDESGVHTFISGIVISDGTQGNNPNGKIIIQNYSNRALGGIALSLDGQSARYLVGDSVIVKAEGATLDRQDGMLQLSGLSIKTVGRISAANTPLLNTNTGGLKEIVDHMDQYECTLVKIENVALLDVQRGQTLGNKNVEMTDGAASIWLKTSDQAAFAAKEVPIEGSFTGIVYYSEARIPFLSIRSSSDYTGKFLAPEEYYGFPEGWENIIGTRKAGNVSTSGYDEYPSGRWYLFQALTRGLDPQFHNTIDNWTLMMSGAGESRVSMEFDVLFGASKFSFYYSAATKLAGDAGNMDLYVEYSQDSGQTWKQLGEKLTIANDPLRPQYFKEFNGLTIEGMVRFRVRKTAGGGRVTIDNINIKPYK